MDRKNIYDIFNVFYKSGLHGTMWPKGRTVCICKYMFELGDKNKYVGFALKENEVSQLHAEVQLLRHLEDLEENQGIIPKYLCIYINYSPCSDCSNELLIYLETHPSVGIEIVFCQLYYVQRRSCQQRRPERKCCLNGITEHEKGLYNLKANNVSLRPYNREDWKHLIKILYHLKETNPSEYEGQILLDEGLYKMFFYNDWGYFNSRENEDMLLLDDWRELDLKFQSTSVDTNEQIWDLYQRCDGAYGTTWMTTPCCIVAYYHETILKLYMCPEKLIEKGEHPMVNALDFLENHWKQNGWPLNSDITIFCTHSPCRGCCQKITKFMGKYSKEISKLSIRFVQLHQVKQAQCYPREWLQAIPITDMVHNETVKALSDLKANGKIDIKPFDASSWSALRQVLDLPQLQCLRELQYQECLGIKPELLIDWECLEAEMAKIQDGNLAAQINQLNITN